MVFRVIVLATLVALVAGFGHPHGDFKKLSADVKVRKAQNGRVITTNATICYTSEGKMVTRFNIPKEQVIINNNKGDVIVYDPIENTVYQEHNYTYSTETSQFYYFLRDRSGNLGLRQMGFVLKNSKNEDGLIVSEWFPPAEMMKKLTSAKLVFKDGTPIYMSFTDHRKKIIKKTYFYQFTKVGYAKFPQAITNIFYNEAGDSIVEKTTYTNVRIDAQANDSYLDFKVPANARSIK